MYGEIFPPNSQWCLTGVLVPMGNSRGMVGWAEKAHNAQSRFTDSCSAVPLSHRFAPAIM
jgi:hypothetical protein